MRVLVFVDLVTNRRRWPFKKTTQGKHNTSPIENSKHSENNGERGAILNGMIMT